MAPILQTIASLDSRSGGTSTCTYDLVKALNASGMPTDILTLQPGSPQERMVGEDSFIHACPFDARTPLAVSRNIRRFLAGSRYCLYHTNGLWLDVNHATCAHARKMNAPCVVSLHGMLYPQALERGGWKKKLMLALGHRKDISGAACVHVTCEKEMEYYRDMGFSNPVAVIPNPVRIPEYLADIRRPGHEGFRAGFLGRLHPIKNLEALISLGVSCASRTRSFCSSVTETRNTRPGWKNWSGRKTFPISPSRALFPEGGSMKCSLPWTSCAPPATRKTLE